MPYGVSTKERAEELAQELALREPEYRFEVAPWEIVYELLGPEVKRWGVKRWQQNYAPPKMPERLLGFAWFDKRW